MIGYAEILLIDPKYPHNVGGAVRAASCFGASYVTFTGTRVPDPNSFAMSRFERRLPREERMRAFRDVTIERLSASYTSPFDAVQLVARRWRGVDVDLTPVCVEFDDSAERLSHFVHPENALYVFGPEDDSVPKSARAACHRFVTIPTKSCVNLAAAVYITLYDRQLKRERADVNDSDPQSVVTRLASSNTIAYDEDGDPYCVLCATWSVDKNDENVLHHETCPWLLARRITESDR